MALFTNTLNSIKVCNIRKFVLQLLVYITYLRLHPVDPIPSQVLELLLHQQIFLLVVCVCILSAVELELFKNVLLENNFFNLHLVTLAMLAWYNV